MTVQPHLPEPLAAWMGPFLAGRTRPTGRHALVWTSATFATSRSRAEVAEIARTVLEQLVLAACYPA